MLAHALLAFTRSLTRHRLFAALNLLGLASGIAVFLTLMLVVKFEFGYEHWLPGSGEIYRLDQIWSLPGEAAVEYDDVSFLALGLLRTDFPQIKAGTRIYSRSLAVSQGATLADEAVNAVDSDFFSVFRLPLLDGSIAHALDPGQIVITEAIAQKYFSTPHALGRTLQVMRDGKKQNFTVSAVLRDLPADTTLKSFSLITALTPAIEDGARAFQRWGSSSGSIYLRIPNPVDAASVAARLRDFVARRASGDGDSQVGKGAENVLTLKLVNLRDAHFHDVSIHASVPGADRRVVISLGAIGLLAMAMAAINYINLATARADLRAREVALRKVAGATRFALMTQFIVESIVLVAAAALVGLALTEIAVPFVNAYGGWALQIDYARIVPMLLALTLLLGAGAGLYPALLLAAFNPARVLAAARLPAGGRQGGRLRAALVLVQFIGAIAFAICTLVIDLQADFLRNADRGFQRDNLVIVRNLSVPYLKERQNAILDALRAVPGVVSATQADREPDSNSNSDTDVHVPGLPGPNPTLIYETVGRDYLPTYGAKLAAGRFFDGTRVVDDSAGKTIKGRTISAVINVSALPVMGFHSAAEALGKRFTIDIMDGSATCIVIGVIGDIRFMSPRSPIEPEFYLYSNGPIEDAQAAVRTEGVPAPEMIARLEAAWRKLVPDVPLVAKTADERLEDFYKPDQQRARLFSIGAVLAIGIACIGLYGLAAFSTSRRVQEIGIRKTLGASTRDVLLLLLGQFVRPVLIANVVAWPLAWAAMQAWLSGFDSRIALSPLYFVVVGIGALALSVLTVLGQAWRVAGAPPARALRCE